MCKSLAVNSSTPLFGVWQGEVDGGHRKGLPGTKGELSDFDPPNTSKSKNIFKSLASRDGDSDKAALQDEQTPPIVGIDLCVSQYFVNRSVALFGLKVNYFAYFIVLFFISIISVSVSIFCSIGRVVEASKRGAAVERSSLFAVAHKGDKSALEHSI